MTRPRKCKVCRAPFVPRTTTQVVCSVACAYAKTLKDRQKKERKNDRERRERLKTLSDWAREAQAAVNAYVRERDLGLPCISCGRMHSGSWDAGHYRSVGAAPHLRYDLANINRQCVPCNQHKSGNAVAYRIGLVNRIGVAEVERLESDNTSKKWTADELRVIRDRFRAMLREIQARNQDQPCQDSPLTNGQPSASNGKASR